MVQNKCLPNRFLLWKFIKDQFPSVNVDVEKTLRLPIGWFVDNDGVTHQTPYLQTMLAKLNEVYNTTFLEQHCRVVGFRFTVFWEDDESKAVKEDKTEEGKVAVQERKEDEEKVELQQEDQEVVSSDIVGSKDTLESEDTPEFDMEEVYKIKALANEKKQKIELEKYGRKFGVELSRRKTFDNMLVDLKAAL